MTTGNNEVTSLRNPIIGPTTADTLFQVQCCLGLIGRIHEDASDWKVRTEESDIGGPDELSWEEHRGLSLLTACVRSAVLYELERVDSLPSD